MSHCPDFQNNAITLQAGNLSSDGTGTDPVVGRMITLSLAGLLLVAGPIALMVVAHKKIK